MSLPFEPAAALPPQPKVEATAPSQARGKSVLYSSHILEVVERVCTRVIVLYEGTVVADDSVDRLQTLMARTSLEGVFSKLVMRIDPELVARDLADAAALGA